MTGGPSQIDLFDPKPLLNRLDGQPLPPSFGKIHSQFLESNPLCMGSHRKWGKYGQAGLDMSDLVPHLHQHADDIAVIRSCVADSVIHAPAMYQMMTGRIFMGHPSLGSWVTLRAGLGEREPARLRRHDAAGRDARRGRSVLGRGLLAGALPGNAVPQRTGADRQSQAAGRVLDGPAAQDPRPGPRDERAGAGPGRHRALGADRDVRAGLPHAKCGARGR